MEDRGKDWQVDIEQLSPEKLEKEIEKNKKKAVKSFAFAVAAAVALIALCIAWFVSNNRVNGILGGISAKKSGIEIGSKGSAGVHDDLLQKIKSGLIYHLPKEAGEKQHDTSQGESINWLLKDDSNMNNYDNGNPFAQTGKIYRKEYAMEPGTKGKLDFFIKSYADGDLSLEFSLDVAPYTMNGETQQAVEKTSIEAQLLSGHILYFLGETQKDSTIKYTWLKDGTFQITIPDAKSDKEYDYYIYWVWPLNLSTILLNNGDDFLNGNEVEFDDKDPTGALRNEIVADMAADPGRYFFSSLTDSPLDKDYVEVQEILNIHQSSGSDPTYNKQLFVDLSSYYNQADMKIGGKISLITATLEYLGKTETTETTKETTEAGNEDEFRI